MVPPAYFILNISIAALMIYYAFLGAQEGSYWETLFPSVNALLYFYGIWRFIGIHEGVSELLRACKKYEAPAVS
ncbi:MAG: cellulose synthase (UDP-forming) [Paracoccaceae bacterium]|jgi:hypothetical protein